MIIMRMVLVPKAQADKIMRLGICMELQYYAMSCKQKLSSRVMQDVRRKNQKHFRSETYNRLSTLFLMSIHSGFILRYTL